MIEAGKTMLEATVKAQAYSAVNPTKYVTIVACFGLFLNVADRLHVFAPSDSAYPCYWKAGKEKRFTEAQRVTDQNKTPQMA